MCLSVPSSTRVAQPARVAGFFWPELEPPTVHLDASGTPREEHRIEHVRADLVRCKFERFCLETFPSTPDAAVLVDTVNAFVEWICVKFQQASDIPSWIMPTVAETLPALDLSNDKCRTVYTIIHHHYHHGDKFLPVVKWALHRPELQQVSWSERLLSFVFDFARPKVLQLADGLGLDVYGSGLLLQDWVERGWAPQVERALRHPGLKRGNVQLAVRRAHENERLTLLPLLETRLRELSARAANPK